MRVWCIKAWIHVHTYHFTCTHLMRDDAYDTNDICAAFGVDRPPPSTHGTSSSASVQTTSRSLASSRLTSRLEPHPAAADAAAAAVADIRSFERVRSRMSLGSVGGQHSRLHSTPLSRPPSGSNDCYFLSPVSPPPSAAAPASAAALPPDLTMHAKTSVIYERDTAASTTPKRKRPFAGCLWCFQG
jgi:hypothetical protein